MKEKGFQPYWRCLSALNKLGLGKKEGTNLSRSG